MIYYIQIRGICTAKSNIFKKEQTIMEKLVDLIFDDYTHLTAELSGIIKTLNMWKGIIYFDWGSVPIAEIFGKLLTP
jgi:hypothetical protein